MLQAQHVQAAQPPYKDKEQEHPGLETQMQTKPDHGEESYKGHGFLKDKVAIVTGGDSGIGRAVCIAFAKEGCKGIVFQHLAEEKADAEETMRWINSVGECKGVSVPGDLQDNEALCKNLIDTAVKQFGKLDILVLNAAFQGKAVKGFEELPTARVKKAFDVNVISMFSMVRLAKPHMKEGGAIITTSSIQSYDPSEAIADYAVTKAAVTGFTKVAAREMIEKGVRVNSVAPGPVWTPIIVQSFGPDKIKEFGKTNPMGRPAQPVELSPVYVFLASDAARFIVGETIGVTGGRLLP